MALKPTDIPRERLEHKAEADALETKIDQVLRANYIHGRRFTFDLPNGISEIARGMVIARYASAGWHVKHGSDQREGDWLEFTPYKSWGEGDK